LVISGELKAQRDLPLRIELETTKKNAVYHLKSVENHGCFIFFKGQTISKDSTIWLFTLLDTNLIKKKSFPIPLPSKIQYITSAYSDNVAWFLFQEQKNKKSPITSYILSINLINASVNIEKNALISDPNIYAMHQFENFLLFNTKKKDEEKIYVYHLFSKRFSEIETPSPIYSVEFQQIDTFNHRIFIGLQISTSRFMMLELNKNGAVEQELFFPKINENSYHTARLAVADSLSTLIIGTYSINQGRTTNNFQSGIYTLLYKDDKFQQPIFYNFTQLETRDSSSKKNNKSLNLLLAVGDIAVDSKQEQFTLTGEVFNPEYRHSTYNYFDDNLFYSPYSTTFIGYRYVNVYVTTFNKNGELLWHHYLPFENILTQRVTVHVKVFYEGENAVIYYPFNSNLNFTRVHKYEVLDKMATIPIETLHYKDVIKYSQKLKIENWYQNNFLISGYQYINNNSKAYKSKRFVFFINKLRYQ